MRKYLFLTLICAGLLNGCSKISPATDPYVPSCNGTTKSYKNDVAPLVQSACSGCHSNFSSFSSLYSSRSSVRSMIVSGQMPQGGGLTNVQRDVIVCWIDNGAPNN